MKIHTYIHLIILLAGALFLYSSCEMQKDLTGNTDTSGGGNTEDLFGALQLTLTAEKEAEIPSKVEDENKEETPLDLNLFAVDILDENYNTVKQYDTYREMLESGTIILSPGLYYIKAKLGELTEAAFDKPYYQGINPFVINSKEVTSIQTNCSLGNVKVTIATSEDFSQKFRDDYTIILTNGNGILTQNKNEKRSAFFTQRNELGFIIHTTTQDGKNLTYSQNLYEDDLVGDYNNILVNLDIVPDTIPENPNPGPGPDPGPEDPDPNPNPGEEGDGSLTLKLVIDISLIEKEYIIEIPSVIVDPEEPGPDPGPGDDSTPTITGPGLSSPIVLTVAEAKGGADVKLTIKTPGGLKNLKVLITTDNAEFREVLTEIGLYQEFDMMNLAPAQKEFLSEVGLNPPTDSYSNLFDISDFVPMIALFGSGEYKFKLTAVDEAGKSTTKTLTIKLTN